MSISLFRPFAEKVQPPRALWVPFPFGRPLGAPNNKAIQRKVILRALDLLSHKSGPVLEDLELSESEQPLDAKNQKIGQKCGPKGCNFDDALSSEGLSESREIAAYKGDFKEVCEEITSLSKLHEKYMQEYGERTQIGYSGVTVATIDRAAELIHRFAQGESIDVPPGVNVPASASDATRTNVFIRLCADDLKAYYLESRLAERQSNGENSTEHNDWLWYETKMGGLIVAARDRVIQTTDRTTDPNWMVARAMVPRGYGESGYTMHSQDKVVPEAS